MFATHMALVYTPLTSTFADKSFKLTKNLVLVGNTHFNILYLFYFKYTKECSYEETVNCYVEGKSVNRARIYTIIF